MALVLQECTVNDQANLDEPILEIKGREAGLVLWLLTILKITPVTTFSVYYNKIIINQASIHGKIQNLIPITSISQCYLAYYKPWKSACFLCLVFLKFYGIGILIGFLYYYLNKELQMVFIDKSGFRYTICFKRSLIEGKSFADEEANEIHSMIDALITQNK
jgi:hypothetical protein